MMGKQKTTKEAIGSKLNVEQQLVGRSVYHCFATGSNGLCKSVNYNNDEAEVLWNGCFETETEQLSLLVEIQCQQ